MSRGLSTVGVSALPAGWIAAGLGVLALLGTAACSSTPVEITASPADTAADQPTHVRVEHLPAGETVEVRAEATDRAAKGWAGHATFTVPADGTLDLDRAVPLSGTYTGADGMGLIWSMRLAADDSEGNFVPGWTMSRPSTDIRLSVRSGSSELAHLVVTRRWMPKSVLYRERELGPDGILADEFSPPAAGRRLPPVLTLGGSDGGRNCFAIAQALAAHGAWSMCLGYFREPGLPQTLNDIPIEYFVKAARQLASDAGTGQVVVEGNSRGSEPALLLAQYHPELISGVILYAPDDQVLDGFPGGGNAWTLGGRPVPQRAIPLDRLDAPVIAFAGDDDTLGPSAERARAIMANLDAAGVGAAHRAIVYPGAGHLAATIPYVPTSVTQLLLTGPRHLGGTARANERAREGAWRQTLAFLDALT